MRTTNLKAALIAVTSTAALSLALGINPAAAVQPTFTVNPNVTGSPATLGVTGYSNFNADQMNGLSNALIQQTGALTQTETGTLQLENFSLNGSVVPRGTTGLEIETGTGTAPAG